MSVADYAEIVKALRLCSAVNSSCEECPCNDPADDLCECANKVSIAAADAIENLLTENAALRRMIGNLTDEKTALVKELHDSKSELNAATGTVNCKRLWMKWAIPRSERKTSTASSLRK